MPKICTYKECSYPVFAKNYCKAHQYLRTDKKPLKAKEYKPINKVSKKQQILNREYLKRKEEYLKDHPLCVARLEGCTRLATDIHHTTGRGVNLLKVETWIGVCRNCHTIIENNPLEAKEKQLSQSRLKL